MSESYGTIRYLFWLHESNSYLITREKGEPMRVIAELNKAKTQYNTDR